MRKKDNKSKQMDCKDLCEKLDLLLPFLGDFKLIHMLGNICFDSNTNQIYASNLEQTLVLDYECDKTYAIKGDMFVKLLKSYKTDIINYQYKDSELCLNVNNSKLKLPIELDTEKFIDIQSCGKKKKVGKFTSDFIIGLKLCSNIEVEGIYVYGSKEKLILYSTDAKSISRYACDIECDNEFKLFLPMLFVKQLILLYDKFGDGDIYFVDDLVLVTWKQGEASTKIPSDIEYIDFESNYDRYDNDDDFISVDDNFVSSLERSSLLLSQDFEQIVCISLDENILVCGAQSQYGEVDDSFEFKGGNEGGGLFASDTLFKTCLQVDRFKLISNDSNVVFLGKKDNNFTCMLMEVVK